MSENSNAALAAACLSVGLVNAWAPAASGAVEFPAAKITSNLQEGISHAIILMGDLGSDGVVIADPVLPGGIISSGGWVTWAFDATLTADDYGSGYAMIGIRDLGNGLQSLVVGGNNLTWQFGASFEEAFPGYSADILLERILAGGPDGEAFLRDHFSTLITPYGMPAQAVAFSQGVDFGTLTVEIFIIPAPGVSAIMAIGLAASLQRRRPR